MSATSVSMLTSPLGNVMLDEDSKNRSFSIRGFQDTIHSIAAKTMRNELNSLVGTAAVGPNQKLFQVEMEAFYHLFTRYLNEVKSGSSKLDWSKIKSPGPEQILNYKALAQPAGEENVHNILSKLAVLKLNGGLGTTMGCVGPKSAIEVRDGMTFLDLTVRQIEYLNEKYSVNVPLILMNSFNTDEETNKIIQKYTGHDVKLMTFNQSRFPRILKETLTPMPTEYSAPNSCFYPPGHGDMFESLANSGLLDQLIESGVEYIFVSNVDNLGATVDLSILEHMIKTGSEFIMEVTDKTKADIKGGTLIDYDGTIRLLEIAQVPSEHLDDFKSIKKIQNLQYKQSLDEHKGHQTCRGRLCPQPRSHCQPKDSRRCIFL